MGNVSFSDRFELFELVREGEVQTFRARERATGRDVQVHLSASPELLARFESSSVLDRGSHEGKLYVVTTPLGLNAVGAWRIKPAEKAPPGDFTRMFELRQAPEAIATPAVKAVQAPVVASQPGEFTRVFKKPAAATAVAPGSTATGERGAFTRMFQQPVTPPPAPAPTPTSAPKGRIPVGLIVTAILIISAIGVFLLVRTLY